MDKNKLLGKRVEHFTWGTGTIISIEGNYVVIAFENGEVKKYQFPVAFIKYLKASDPGIQKEIEKDLQSVGSNDKSIVPGRPASKEVPAHNHSPKHRTVKDAATRTQKACKT